MVELQKSSLDQSPGIGQKTLILVICLLVAAFCILVAWAMPRPLGDLYVYLAGGRDVLDGKLAQPDDWAFSTAGRVWINQNWGTGVIFYLTHKAAGDIGLLVLKVLILVAAAFFIAQAARQRGSGWAIAILLGGAALGAAPDTMTMRANLFTMMFAPAILYVFYLTRRNVHLIWVAVAVIGLWANLHGGFIFGLGMIGLWTICQIVPHAIREGPASALQRYWPLLAGTVTAIVLAGAANPFGLENITHPFIVARSEVWRQVTEWRHIFSKKLPRVPLPWGFFVVLSALSISVILHVTVDLLRGRPLFQKIKDRQVGVLVFEISLAAILLFMAFRARRFVPLATVLLAPFIAVHLHWLLNASRFILPTAVVAVALLGAMVVDNTRMLRHYSPANPTRPTETFLQRMVRYETHFPVGAAEFLNANNISGRVFHEWRWEGFIKWRRPQMKVFMGGRAQQIYDEQTYWERRSIVKGDQSVARLAKLDVHLAIVPISRAYLVFHRAITKAPGASWAYIYADRYSAVLADAAWPDTRKLIELAAAGKLKYPDPASAALSKAMSLYSPAVRGPYKEVVESLQQAAKIQSSLLCYEALTNIALPGEVEIPKAEELEYRKYWIDYFQSEASRLSAMDSDHPDGIYQLKCLRGVYSILSSLYIQTRQFENMRRAKIQMQQVEVEIKNMIEAW